MSVVTTWLLLLAPVCTVAKTSKTESTDGDDSVTGQDASGHGCQAEVFLPTESPRAMLFFFLALLSCLLVPWTAAVLWHLLFPGRAEVAKAFPETSEQGSHVRYCRTQAMEARREAALKELRSRKLSGGFLGRLVILMLLWCWLIYIIIQVRQVLATSALYQNFDPYEILDVGMTTSTSQIKKAYHKLSLKYHPDKNKEEGAAEKFMLIKKAYDALTDPVAKRNYRAYGNPDGPTRVQLDVALPTISKENQGLVLVLFLLLFVIGVPLMMLYCMGSSSVDNNGLPRETNKVLAEGFSPSLDAKQLQELILRAYAAAEKPKNEEPLDELRQELQAAGASFSRAKRGAENGEAEDALALQRAETLFWGHILRRTDLLRERARELDGALKQWQVASRFLLKEAASHGQADGASSCLDFHRGLVQAIEPAAASKPGSVLSQIPHFSSEQIKLWQKRQKKYSTLSGFVEMPSEERRAALEAPELGLSPSQLADIEEFVAVVPRMQIQDAHVFVHGEDEICVGDIATLEIKLLRANLREGEAIGAAHAPHFPGKVSEAWWLTFRLPGKGKSGSSVCSRITDTSREVVANVRFRVPLAGKCRIRLSLACEAYAGFEFEKEVNYVAKQAQQPVHDDDSDVGSEEIDMDFED
ncbi:ERDJ2A [Symbiodinium natans]|uniref:ERDJ2A protein n=1 Tax=Symbiodinium natans TaxID=878477 RepID=A0A812TXX3_9DINO|nr:ERDJ2A [Symbiodinium natans]